MADGGSRDDTCARARAAGARVVTASRGRGAQMNTGAACAGSALLLFLHADTRVPGNTVLADAVACLRTAGAPTAPVAGHFPLRFERSLPGNERTWRFLEAKTALARPWTVNGDQGLLIGRPFFEALGGFDTRLPYLEDQRIGALIRAHGRWITLPGRLHTSARRFEREGLGVRLRIMILIMGAHAAGLDEFFARAPHVYRVQHDTGPLRLTPFLDLLAAVLRALPPDRRRACWRAVGSFTRANLWQLALMVDVARGREVAHPCLNTFDRYLASRLDRAAVDALCAHLARFWVLGVWRLWYRLREDRQSARA